MYRVICTLEHASDNINDIPFHRTDRGMESVDPVADDIAEVLATIPGYKIEPVDASGKTIVPAPVEERKVRINPLTGLPLAAGARTKELKDALAKEDAEGSAVFVLASEAASLVARAKETGKTPVEEAAEAAARDSEPTEEEKAAAAEAEVQRKLAEAAAEADAELKRQEAEAAAAKATGDQSQSTGDPASQQQE